MLTAELHAVAVGQHLDGRREVEPLGRLHELDRVARLPAAEAVEDLLLRADRAEAEIADGFQRIEQILSGL